MLCEEVVTEKKIYIVKSTQSSLRSQFKFTVL